MSMVKLSSLKSGDRAVIRDIHANDDIRQRMHSMGIRTGRETQIIRRGSLGGPMQIRIGSISLVVRSSDASLVDVNLAS